jgi:hypothetical protein
MNKPIVFIGNQIQQSHTEVLQPVDLYSLYKRIKGDEELSSEIARLRKVALMDRKAYQRVKTRLPYFCCASFENGIRRGVHFKSISCFVIDIDKLPMELMAHFKRELQSDPRVKMMFVSPGGQGIKLIFELSAPCKSLKEYSDFYRTFAFHLSETYHLSQYLDTSTCDATRVTFLSYDEDAIYNTLNQPLNLRDFLPAEIFSKQAVEEISENSENNTKKEELPEELYREILLKLNPDARIPSLKKKQIFVPEALNEIESPVKAEFIKLGIGIREIKNIHYGKKFIIEHGFKFGEVNLFYGSRGFSVVQTAKSGSDEQLNKIGEMVIRKILAEGIPERQDEAKAPYTLN